MDDNERLYAMYLKHFALARSGYALTPDSFMEVKEAVEENGLRSVEDVEYNNRELVALALGVSSGHAQAGKILTKAEVVGIVARKLTAAQD